MSFKRFANISKPVFGPCGMIAHCADKGHGFHRRMPAGSGRRLWDVTPSSAHLYAPERRADGRARADCMGTGCRPSHQAAFTMAELLIAMTIMAILAVVATPAVMTSLRDTRRSDGQNALLRIQMEQEKWRANATAYTSSLADLGLSATSPEGYYTIDITAANATGFTATATATGSQSGDTACAKMTLAQDGANSTTAPHTCWKK